VYEGLDYVLDVAIQKGRWKKKRFHKEMDDIEKGYGNDRYGLGDFDQIKNKVYCSVAMVKGTP
jgi:hypothetical protein